MIGAGLVGVPGRTAYSATKFAMSGFFEALRAELKSAGVSVTTAYPGVVERVEVGPHGADIRLRTEGLASLVRDLGVTSRIAA